jgi:hypothetical protein
VELNALDPQLLFILIHLYATKVQRTILFVENHYTIRIQVQPTVILVPHKNEMKIRLGICICHKLHITVRCTLLINEYYTTTNIRGALHL